MSKNSIFDDCIIEWMRQSSDLKTWEAYKVLFCRAHRYQRRAVTTARKVGYTVAVQNIYGMQSPSPPEEHNTAI